KRCGVYFWVPRATNQYDTGKIPTKLPGKDLVDKRHRTAVKVRTLEIRQLGLTRDGLAIAPSQRRETGVISSKRLRRKLKVESVDEMRIFMS
ncbi:MAG TPA: hypothetical protein VFS84_09380, partial [Candidatus Binatia bacterium]|nr:hypothetical protein [Candidatus Binatia bacterium]